MLSTVLSGVNSSVLVAEASAALCNAWTVKTASAIRLENFEDLVREAGSLAELARRAETNPIYLSQLRSQATTRKGTKRGIGDQLARRLESAMGKPIGWLDQEHAGGQRDLVLTDQERDLVLAFRALPDDHQSELVGQLMVEAEKYTAYAQRVLRNHGVTGVAPNERVAEALPPAPQPAKVTALAVHEREGGYLRARRAKPARRKKA